MIPTKIKFNQVHVQLTCHKKKKKSSCSTHPHNGNMAAKLWGWDIRKDGEVFYMEQGDGRMCRKLMKTDIQPKSNSSNTYLKWFGIYVINILFHFTL